MAKIKVLNPRILTYATKRNLRSKNVGNGSIIYGFSREVKRIKLLVEITEFATLHGSVLIALDGDSAAGKTTFAAELSQVLPLNIIKMDDFIRVQPPMRQTEKKTIASNIDFKLLQDFVTANYLKNNDIYYKPFDFKTHTHGAKITLKHNPNLLVEGAFALHPQNSELPFDFKIVFKINRLKQYRRIRKRNGKTALKMFKKYWIYNERRYQKLYAIHKQATHIIYC